MIYCHQGLGPFSTKKCGRFFLPRSRYLDSIFCARSRNLRVFFTKRHTLNSQTSSSSCIHLVYVRTWTLTAYKASATNYRLYKHSYTKTERHDCLVVVFLLFSRAGKCVEVSVTHTFLWGEEAIYYRKMHRNVNARLTLVSIQYNTEFVLCIAFLSSSGLPVWDVPEQHESLMLVSYL